MEDEVSHAKVLVLVSPPWHTLARVFHLTKSQGGQQNPEPAMHVLKLDALKQVPP